MSEVTSSPELDISLLPVYQRYRLEDPTLTLWQYLHERADYDLATAFSKLFWPSFVEIDGCVFLAERYSAKNYETWVESLGAGKRQSVEAVINHTHVYDLFYNGPHLPDQPDSLDFTLPLYEYLAKVLIAC